MNRSRRPTAMAGPTKHGKEGVFIVRGYIMTKYGESAEVEEDRDGVDLKAIDGKTGNRRLTSHGRN